MLPGMELSLKEKRPSGEPGRQVISVDMGPCSALWSEAIAHAEEYLAARVVVDIGAVAQTAEIAMILAIELIGQIQPLQRDAQMIGHIVGGRSVYGRLSVLP